MCRIFGSKLARINPLLEQINRGNFSDTSVCQGDSGGPLVFPKTLGNDERYYVRGIVSTSPATSTSTCDSNQYGTYTSVAKHITFIRDLVTLNRLT